MRYIITGLISFFLGYYWPHPAPVQENQQEYVDLNPRTSKIIGADGQVLYERGDY